MVCGLLQSFQGIPHVKYNDYHKLHFLRKILLASRKNLRN